MTARASYAASLIRYSPKITVGTCLPPYLREEERGGNGRINTGGHLLRGATHFLIKYTQKSRDTTLGVVEPPLVSEAHKPYYAMEFSFGSLHPHAPRSDFPYGAQCVEGALCLVIFNFKFFDHYTKFPYLRSYKPNSFLDIYGNVERFLNLLEQLQLTFHSSIRPVLIVVLLFFSFSFFL